MFNLFATDNLHPLTSLPLKQICSPGLFSNPLH
jgi:hypothetical protein